MLRLIHTADWQIGREFGQFEADDAAALAAARFDIIGRIVEHATATDVRLIVVAGDVFDAPTIGDKAIQRVFNALDLFAGHWVLLPGNHDPALAAGVWVRARALGCIGPRTHLASTPGVINIDALSVSLLVAPLTQRNTLVDTTDPFDDFASPAGHYRIGVAHGSIGGLLPEESLAGNPISPNRAASAQLDYLALGDWHGQKKVNERCWYSGTPEPDRFRANEPGYILEVALTRPGAVPTVTPVPIASFKWHDIQVTLSDSSDIEALENDLLALGASDVVRLKIDGKLSMEQHRRLDGMTSKTAAKTRALREDRAGLTLSMSDEDISSLQIDGYLAQVLTDLQDPETDLADEVRHEALRLFAEVLDQQGRPT